MFDVTELIRAGGYAVLFAIIFAESGLLIGVFLPGDSLLFTAGFLASQGLLDLAVICVGCFIAAVVGDAVGYAMGRSWGRPLFDRPDSRFFKRAHLKKAEAFYEKYGAKTIVIARWTPIIRTFAPVLAGVADMQYRKFAIYNFTGAALWAIGLPAIGYWLGASIPAAGKYLELIVVIIVILSLTPTALHIWQDHRTEIMAWLRERFSRDARLGETSKPLVREDGVRPTPSTD